jgi:hypothetical protein
MEIVPGEKAAHKWLNQTAANLPPLSLAVAVTAAAAVVKLGFPARACLAAS